MHAIRIAYRTTLRLALGLLALITLTDTPGQAAENTIPAARTQQVAGAGDVLIRYTVYGSLDNARPLIVLVHGWSCDASYWREQLAALTADYTVVTVDLAGHGTSGANRADYSMRSFGEDVQRVVAALPSRAPVILVGHSMGGPVAAEAARLLGDRVRGVIGVDTFASVGLTLPSTAESEARLAPFIKDFAANTQAFVGQAFFRADAAPDLKRWIVEDMAQGDPRVGIAAMIGLNSWDGVSTLRALRVPVITINADRTRTDEARIRALVPGFRVIEMDGVGHFLMLENPARFNPLLRAEIAKLH